MSSTTALELLIGYFITNICKIVINIFLAVEDENNMAGMLCAVFCKIVNKCNVRYMRAHNLTTEIFPLESTHEAENGSYIFKLSNCFFVHMHEMTVYCIQSVFFQTLKTTVNID